jgi:hypothetical protein
MGTMRFMSTPSDRKALPKIFSFDSSPGRAIGQALGAGMWDEKSYTAELKETLPGEETVYEVKMRRASTDTSPGPHPLVKVGILHHTPSY